MTHELDVEFGRIWKYWYGDPADRDYRRSIPMLRRLVDSGYAPASYALGMAYYDGKGVRKNYQESYRHLLRAAEASYPDAQNMIGTYFESPPPGDFQGDLIQAAHWYEKAARNGNSSAQYNYARLLRASVDGLIHVATKYPELAAAAKPQVGGRSFTTPTISEYRQMVRQHERLYRQQMNERNPMAGQHGR